MENSCVRARLVCFFIESDSGRYHGIEIKFGKLCLPCLHVQYIENVLEVDKVNESWVRI